MFSIKNLTVLHKKNLILKNINLEINKGEIHAIMGPNGSGKSTLAKVIMGDPSYKIESGLIELENQDISSLETEKRSLQGIFLANQNPIEIPGVNNAEFLRMIYNNKNKFHKKKELDPIDFNILLKEKMNSLNLSNIYEDRNLNENFSGGEKKKNEILQMLLLNPKICILDEIDSGLDIDALKIITKSIKDLLQSSSYESSIIIITHLPMILNYLNPKQIHILSKGQIIKSGTIEIANILNEKGYQYFIN